MEGKTVEDIEKWLMVRGQKEKGRLTEEEDDDRETETETEGEKRERQ